MKKSATQEPNFDTACAWWSDLPNIWTPIGWKNHLFRFNIMWSGMIYANPFLSERTKKYEGLGMQLAFFPTTDGKEYRDAFVRHDDDSVTQGWMEAPAPVLWTEFRYDGVVLRQYVFGHVPGASDVKTGVDPLFAWVRLVVHDLCQTLPLEKKSGFVLRLNAPHLGRGMCYRSNIWFQPEISKYPRMLRWESPHYSPRTGWRLLEPDGRVRLGIPPGQRCLIGSLEPKELSNFEFGILMDTKKGAHVDLLLPLVPSERATFDRELAAGYHNALEEANRYWGKIPKSGARVSVPEPFVNETIRHSLRFGELLAEKFPDTGKYCMVSGSFAYAMLWATPASMTCTMLMDLLGYHDVCGKYLEVFREEQGTVTPPGPAYKPRPGYLSTPPLYKSIDWICDNGAILHALATHALLSGDRDFIARFTDTIIRSCDWIRDARAVKGHGGVEDILPPAVASDQMTVIQAVWSDGWNYKGLSTSVKLLRRIGHPRADEFAREARRYREAFAAALRKKCRKAPTWTDARGRRRPLVPTALSGDTPRETRHPFYLDAGPLFLVYSGLLDADDPLMESSRLWFREGPPTRFYRRESDPFQVPVLDHEISSCEPCYSWNVFHAWRLGDRQLFMEGMYSLLAGALSRRTYISCETRGGITGNIFSAPLAIYLARLAVIDDELRDGELHLIRLMPLAWLGSGQEAVFEEMPTCYGPVTLRTKVNRSGSQLDVIFRPSFRTAPKRVLLHIPPIAGLSTLKVNGRTLKNKGNWRIHDLHF